jgi:hypothetical protein
VAPLFMAVYNLSVWHHHFHFKETAGHWHTKLFA